jgi:hypothetical protein
MVYGLWSIVHGQSRPLVPSYRLTFVRRWPLLLLPASRLARSEVGKLTRISGGNRVKSARPENYGNNGPLSMVRVVPSYLRTPLASLAATS